MRHTCHISSNKMIKEDDIQRIIDKLRYQFNIGNVRDFEYTSMNPTKYEVIIIGEFDEYDTLEGMKSFVRLFTSELRKDNHIISYRWYDN